eukprot:g2897.t1
MERHILRTGLNSFLLMVLYIFFRVTSVNGFDPTSLVNGQSSRSRSTSSHNDGKENLQRVLTSSVQQYQQQNDNQHHIYQYGVMIDSGSTGSRVYIYQWNANTNLYPFTNSLTQVTDPSTGESSMKVKPSITQFLIDPQSAKISLQQLLIFARNTIIQDFKAYHGLLPTTMPSLQKQKQLLARIPVYLKATGGIRMENLSNIDIIMNHIRNILGDSGFYFKNEWANVISGEEEGVFSWLMINALKDSLTPPDASLYNTFGALDLGGASTQITFHPPSKKVPILTGAFPITVEKTQQGMHGTFLLTTDEQGGDNHKSKQCIITEPYEPPRPTTVVIKRGSTTATTTGQASQSSEIATTVYTDSYLYYGLEQAHQRYRLQLIIRELHTQANSTTATNYMTAFDTPTNTKPHPRSSSFPINILDPCLPKGFQIQPWDNETNSNIPTQTFKMLHKLIYQYNNIQNNNNQNQQQPSPQQRTQEGIGPLTQAMVNWYKHLLQRIIFHGESKPTQCHRFVSQLLTHPSSESFTGSPPPPLSDKGLYQKQTIYTKGGNDGTYDDDDAASGTEDSDSDQDEDDEEDDDEDEDDDDFDIQYTNFIAFNGFYYIWDFFKLEPTSDLKTLLEKATVFCLYNNTDLMKHYNVDDYVYRHCFDAMYVKLLLHDGYQLPMEDTPLVVTNSIEDLRTYTFLKKPSPTTTVGKSNPSSLSTTKQQKDGIELTFAFGAMLYELILLKKQGDIMALLPMELIPGYPNNQRSGVDVNDENDTTNNSMSEITQIKIIVLVISFIVFILILTNVVSCYKLNASKREYRRIVKMTVKKNKTEEIIKQEEQEQFITSSSSSKQKADNGHHNYCNSRINPNPTVGISNGSRSSNDEISDDNHGISSCDSNNNIISNAGSDKGHTKLGGDINDDQEEENDDDDNAMGTTLLVNFRGLGTMSIVRTNTSSTGQTTRASSISPSKKNIERTLMTSTLRTDVQNRNSEEAVFHHDDHQDEAKDHANGGGGARDGEVGTNKQQHDTDGRTEAVVSHRTEEGVMHPTKPTVTAQLLIDMDEEKTTLATASGASSGSLTNSSSGNNSPTTFGIHLLHNEL